MDVRSLHAVIWKLQIPVGMQENRHDQRDSLNRHENFPDLTQMISLFFIVQNLSRTSPTFARTHEHN
jgi:hypothetical protein